MIRRATNAADAASSSANSAGQSAAAAPSRDAQPAAASAANPGSASGASSHPILRSAAVKSPAIATSFRPSAVSPGSRPSRNPPERLNVAAAPFRRIALQRADCFKCRISRAPR